jgi:hypothetical protein
MPWNESNRMDERLRLGSSPFSRTVLRRLQPLDPAVRLVGELEDYEIALCSQIDRPLPYPVMGISSSEHALA